MSGDQSLSLSIDGTYFRSGSFHQFTLPRRAMLDLASALGRSARQARELRVWIGTGVLLVAYGQVCGTASCGEDGVVLLRSNRVDVVSIAEELRAIAQEPRTETALPHIHLEPVYLDSTEEVTDIVFEPEEDDV